jgi:hypothetical protein
MIDSTDSGVKTQLRERKCEGEGSAPKVGWENSGSPFFESDLRQIQQLSINNSVMLMKKRATIGRKNDEMTGSEEDDCVKWRYSWGHSIAGNEVIFGGQISSPATFPSGPAT